MPNLISQLELNWDFFQTVMEEAYDYIEHEPQNIPKRKYEIFKIAFRGNNVFVKLVDSVQLDTVSFVSLTIERHFEKTFHVIKTTFSKFKERGFLKYIFAILLFDFGFTIMSDNIHTIPGSMNFWKALKKLENTECRIINIDTQYNRQYIDQPDTAIWGLNDGYFTDGKINGFVVDGLYAKKVICDQLYNFILENSETLQNRNTMRLYTLATQYSS